ncbi:maleylpyruvate isomerase N-terminal domain-containing protein [Oryzobacter terrae]|uniref:maleylpyruvate isomerase N-terminal domain-containing protein n=1 Tax=Oryzobacter terrae TaxID=1620385 RepID=UPI00366B58AE
MSPTADATVSALRSTYDALAAVVRGLSDEELLAPSAASEWPVAQVLSHLGSGAEIGSETLRTALAGGSVPDGFNQGVWDRWNALTPREQADGYLVADAALVEAVEALTPEQLTTTQVDLGFTPAPLPLASYLGMRLNEAAQHSWDVRVASDEHAAIDDATALLLLDHLADGLGFMLGFTARADEVAQPALVDLAALDHDLSIDGSVSLVPGGATTTARFEGSPDAVARLVSGRLTPAHTPTDVTVSGNLDLDDLRRVFPGY